MWFVRYLGPNYTIDCLFVSFLLGFSFLPGPLFHSCTWASMWLLLVPWAVMPLLFFLFFLFDREGRVTPFGLFYYYYERLLQCVGLSSGINFTYLVFICFNCFLFSICFNFNLVILFFILSCDGTVKDWFIRFAWWVLFITHCKTFDVKYLYIAWL